MRQRSQPDHHHQKFDLKKQLDAVVTGGVCKWMNRRKRLNLHANISLNICKQQLQVGKNNYER